MTALETLPVETLHNVETLPVEAAAIVRAYQQASKADSTVRAYRSDVQVFQAWCARYGFRSLPASPEAVAGFLAHEAEAGRSASTIGRRLAAIRYGHKLAKAADPTDDEDVRATMKGIRRRIGRRARPRRPRPRSTCCRCCCADPDTLTGKRDRALLALGFAGAFRRSELVALDVEDLREDPEGLRVMVRRSKVDQEGRGFEKAIPHGRFIRPVALVREWLDAAGITAGPVFRPVSRSGRVRQVGDGSPAPAPHRPIRRQHPARLLRRRRPRCLDLRGALPAGRLHHDGGRARGGSRPHHGPVRPPGPPDGRRVHPPGQRLQGSLRERVPVERPHLSVPGDL